MEAKAWNPMYFENEADILHWYESEPRTIDAAFMASIHWADVKTSPIDPALAPVIRYMRDVETFTDIYHREAATSPTGKDPHIKAFMDRWSQEEPVHGLLLDRFLKQAGLDEDADWKQKAYARIPLRYRIETRIIRWMTKIVGNRFAAVHMVWGAINEQCTLIGYKRLWETAKHPVLEHILRGIVREEARHSLFYWSMARVKLLKIKGAQRLARRIIEKYWSPVGEGTKPRDEADHVIAILFPGHEGVALMHKYVNERIAQLPGFDGLMRITNRIAEASLRIPNTTPTASV